MGLHALVQKDGIRYRNTDASIVFIGRNWKTYGYDAVDILKKTDMFKLLRIKVSHRLLTT